MERFRVRQPVQAARCMGPVSGVISREQAFSPRASSSSFIRPQKSATGLPKRRRVSWPSSFSPGPPNSTGRRSRRTSSCSSPAQNAGVGRLAASLAPRNRPIWGFSAAGGPGRVEAGWPGCGPGARSPGRSGRPSAGGCGGCCARVRSGRAASRRGPGALRFPEPGRASGPRPVLRRVGRRARGRRRLTTSL